MISIENKVIFTHPPRCGGTSFESLLGLPESGEHFEKYKHASLTEHISYIENLNLKENDFKKVSVIRNPWERMVSWFLFLKKRKNPYVKNTDFQKFVEKCTFHEFIRFINTILSSNSFLKRPYMFYMCDKGSFKIEYLIRYENYESDINKVLNLLNFKNENSDLKLPEKRGCGSNYNYRNFYNRETKNIVNIIYQDDINFFKYCF